MSDPRKFDLAVAGREAPTVIGVINGVSAINGVPVLLLTDSYGWFLRVTLQHDRVRSTVENFIRQQPILDADIMLENLLIESRIEKSSLSLSCTTMKTNVHMKARDFSASSTADFSTLSRYISDYEGHKTRQNTMRYVILQLGEGVASQDGLNVRFETASLPTFTAYTSRTLTKDHIMSHRGQVVIVCHTRISSRTSTFNTMHASFIMKEDMIPPTWRQLYDVEAASMPVYATPHLDLQGILLGGGWTSSAEPVTPRKSPSLPVIVASPQVKTVEPASRVQAVMAMLSSHPHLLEGLLAEIGGEKSTAVKPASKKTTPEISFEGDGDDEAFGGSNEVPAHADVQSAHPKPQPKTEVESKNVPMGERAEGSNVKDLSGVAKTIPELSLERLPGEVPAELGLAKDPLALHPLAALKRITDRPPSALKRITAHEEHKTSGDGALLAKIASSRAAIARMQQELAEQEAMMHKKESSPMVASPNSDGTAPASDEQRLFALTRKKELEAFKKEQREHEEKMAKGRKKDTPVRQGLSDDTPHQRPSSECGGTMSANDGQLRSVQRKKEVPGTDISPVRKAASAQGLIKVKDEKLDDLRRVDVYFKESPQSRTWVKAIKILSAGEVRIVVQTEDGTTKYVDRSRCAYKPP